MTFYEGNQKKCCDPLGQHSDKIVSKGLRVITLEFIAAHAASSQLIPGDKLCKSCRTCIVNDPMSLARMTREHFVQSESELSVSDNSDNELYRLAELDTLNESLVTLGETPVRPDKLNQKHYPEKKVKKIEGNIRKKLKMDITPMPVDSDNDKVTSEYSCLIDKLKQKFNAITDRSEKIKILTILPQTWSIERIQQEFHTSNHMARVAKRLASEKGILSDPNQKEGRKLSNETVSKVKLFYASDEISREMPGIKDCVSVRNKDGTIEKLQKRLILCNLREAYRKFKDSNTSTKIGFSKFTQLRPRNIVLTGGSGSHSVCVCTQHQNVKLMLEGSNMSSGKGFKSLVDPEFKGEVKYQHLLACLLCNPPLPACHLGQCSECGSTEQLEEKLTNIFNHQFTDSITYKSWVTTDRTTLETVVKNQDDFVETLLEKLLQLRRHDFVAKQQSAYLKDKKENLAVGQALVVCDFAENYSFVIQDAAQGFHWNNTQATVHPFVIYYRNADNIEHFSYVVISDCLEHDSVTVHCFQRKMIDFLKSKLGKVEAVFYFSDGAVSQYKNRKNFLNIAHHEVDFGISAEWHFFATSHGKGPCDGVGGTVKRLAARASLQRPYSDHITTPAELFTWIKQNIAGIDTVFVSQQEVKQEATVLNDRLSSALTVGGTHQLHAVIPIPGTTSRIIVKEYSFDESAVRTAIISKEEECVPWDEICGYLCCKYNNEWWLAHVLEKTWSTQEVQVEFLHPAGPSSSFSFPSRADVLIISRDSILLKASPTTATGRMYNLPRDQMLTATRLLNLKS